MAACLGGAALAAQQDDDEDTLKVGRLSLVGVTSIDASRLRQGLVTRSSSRIPWVKKNRFTRTGLEADLRRIEAFYSDRGYPRAHAEATHIDIDRQRHVVDVVVTVKEGEPVLLDDIQLTGTDVIKPERIAVLRRTFTLKVGRPVDSDAVVGSRDLLLREARETGYPFAKVGVSVARDAEDRHATVTLAVDSGTQAVFGPTEVVGNRGISPELVRRQLEYKQGELYKGSLVEASQRRLYGLEVFQFVNLERVETPQQESPVTMRATVAEGKHQRLTGGVGYGSEEKFRVDGEYRNLNAFGGARSAEVHARWSSLDRGIHAQIRQPSFLVSEATLMADGQNWYTYTPAYNSVTTGGRGIFSYESWHHNSYLVTFTGEHDSSSIADSALNDLSLRDELIALGLDPRTGEQNGTLYSLGFDFRRVTVDNLLDPQRGWQIVLHGERAGGFLPGTFDYWSTAGDVRRYHRVTRRLYVRGAGAVRDDFAGERHRSERAVCKTVFPRRGLVDSRLGPLRGQPAQRIGTADRRERPAAGIGRGARDPSRQIRRRGIYRRRERVGTQPADEPDRPALCSGRGRALFDRGRPAARRLGLSDQSDPGPDGRWLAADAPLAAAHQRRAGVLKRVDPGGALIRPSDRVPAFAARRPARYCQGGAGRPDAPRGRRRSWGSDPCRCGV